MTLFCRNFVIFVLAATPYPQLEHLYFVESGTEYAEEILEFDFAQIQRKGLDYISFSPIFSSL